MRERTMTPPRSGQPDDEFACRRNLGSAIFVVLLAVVVSAGLAGSVLAQTTPIDIAGDDPTSGLFDPSVEYAPASTEGWLAYSAVFGPLLPWGPHVETHLARSLDGGSSWTFETIAAPSTLDQLVNFDETLIDGAWNAETPSLVYDAADVGAEWKLFFHRIFRQSNDNFTVEQNLPAYSWIGMRTAASPAGPWSAERALLSSGPFPIAPYDVVEKAINALDPSLENMLVYSEPGAIVANETLYLSLTGLTSTGPDRIILLSSSDHGDSWEFVSTLLSPSEIASMGFDSLDGSAIVEDAGRFFLLATPEIAGVLHDGTIAIEFESLATGLLEQNGGVPEIHLQIPAQPGLPTDLRGGQADYHEDNTAGGLMQPALQTALYPKFFTIANTGLRLVTPAQAPGLGGTKAGVIIVMILLGLAGIRNLRRNDA